MKITSNRNTEFKGYETTKRIMHWCEKWFVEEGSYKMDTTGSLTSSGYCLVANGLAKIGDVVLHCEGVLLETKNKYSVQVSLKTHLHPPVKATTAACQENHKWMYTNHSCFPNVCFSDMRFIAIRPIVPGDHITFDYETNEDTMSEMFVCMCETDVCRGTIAGYSLLTDAERARLKHQTAAYLLEHYALSTTESSF